MTSSDTPVRRSKQPSMGDVARHAGVSSQTVSRVSNGHSNVDPLTRQRVIESMQALGYRPNSAARALRRGHFRAIGVIMFTLRTFGNMSTLNAIATEAARRMGQPARNPIFSETILHRFDIVKVEISAYASH